MNIHQSINLKSWAGGSGMFALRYSRAVRLQVVKHGLSASDCCGWHVLSVPNHQPISKRRL